MKRKISIIAAIDQEKGIGKNNTIPWRFPTDIKWFKEITTQNHQINNVIMGRKTWISIPTKFRPLPQRKNIIISNKNHQNNLENSQAIFTSSFEEALSQCNENLIFVIGGNNIYQIALSYQHIDNIYLTEIQSHFNCDTFFPHSDKIYLKETIKENFENNIKLKFNIYGFKEIYSFSKAKEFIFSFKLKSTKDWYRLTKDKYIIPKPSFFPLPDYPNHYYKNKGWKSWNDFFSVYNNSI